MWDEERRAQIRAELELTYAAHDLAPFVWDEERRAQIRAELEGIYAHPYGLSQDDFAYIPDTFPIVRCNDERAYGEFPIKHLCAAGPLWAQSVDPGLIPRLVLTHV